MQEPATVVSTSDSVTLDDATSFTLDYELFKDDISFTVSFQGTSIRKARQRDKDIGASGLGFAAIGFPSESLNMVDADVIAVVADGSGGCSVGDYWSTGFVAPVEDTANGGSDDLGDAECTIDGDVITASFKRNLMSSDTSDREIDPANIPLIYAFSATAGGLQYHGPTG